MYDIIVIGAGPAGCTSAKIAAEKGYKVLLIEKFKLPRYKSCSGQLINKSIDLVQKYFGYCSYEIDGIVKKSRVKKYPKIKAVKLSSLVNIIQ